MTEFLGTDGGQIAYEVTGLTAAAEEVVAARPELVWDLVADVTRVGGWSPECIRVVWLGEPRVVLIRAWLTGPLCDGPLKAGRLSVLTAICGSRGLVGGRNC